MLANTKEDPRPVWSAGYPHCKNILNCGYPKQEWEMAAARSHWTVEQRLIFLMVYHHKLQNPWIAPPPVCRPGDFYDHIKRRYVRYMMPKAAALVLLLLTHYPWIVHVCLKMHMPLVHQTEGMLHSYSQKHHPVDYLKSLPKLLPGLLTSKNFDVVNIILTKFVSPMLKFETLVSTALAVTATRRNRMTHSEHDCRFVQLLLGREVGSDSLEFSHTTCLPCFRACLSKYVDDWKATRTSGEIESSVLELIRRVVYQHREATLIVPFLQIIHQQAREWISSQEAHKLLLRVIAEIGFDAAAWRQDGLRREPGELSAAPVEFIVDKFEANVNHVDPDSKFTPLAVAASFGLTLVVKFLLSRGAQVNLGSPLFYVANSLSVQVGATKGVRVLETERFPALECFLVNWTAGRGGWVPREYYDLVGCMKTLALLIEAGADLNKGDRGSTPLHELGAYFECPFYDSQVFPPEDERWANLDENWDVDIQTSFALDAIKLLVEKGARLSTKCFRDVVSGETPYEAALRTKNLPTIMNALMDERVQPKITSFFKKKERGEEFRGKRNR